MNEPVTQLGFQSFSDSVEREKTPKRLRALAAILREQNLNGFFVPRSDEFQGEYVAPHSERLAWLTGFTGSAGIGLQLGEQMHLFVDGRYTLQAANQTPQDQVTIEDLVGNPPASWLESQDLKGSTLGFDPWLHTIASFDNLNTTAMNGAITLKPIEHNLIDDLWDDQPAAPNTVIEAQPIDYAGLSADEKIANLCKTLKQKNADAFLLADPTETAWLFNIRSKDVPHTPVALCFALVFASGQSILFADESRFSSAAKKALPAYCQCLPPIRLTSTLQGIAGKSQTLLLDDAQAPVAIRSIIEEANGQWAKDRSPVLMSRALKNPTELTGARSAHLRDGVAMCQFLSWLDAQQIGTVDEITAAKTLEAKRREIGGAFNMPLQDISFDTISGTGPNGAIVHYRVTEETNRTLRAGELYLVDSGGQYADGTTDITRTIAIGAPTDQMKSDFTRVLKGMIAISLARFPKGTRGMDLDPFARAALWQVGLDYGHGTGHGVGAFLSVHEGPQGISKRANTPFESGMIVSNEPGCYREGEYGIRIENLVIVEDIETPDNAMMPIMGFETLTLCPIDLRLINTALLDEKERDWLNSYHAWVGEKLSEYLDDATKTWLQAATQPIR